MKNILTSLFLFVNFFLFSQINDPFSDGDFSANPIWTGQDSSFIVNANNELQLFSFPATDTAYLSTNSTLIDDAEWFFKVRLDFGTSSANLARVYLVSDQADLRGALNGYFVLIGSSDDEVSLYRQDGLSTTKIIDGTDGFVGQSTVDVNVKASRLTNGDWTLSADNTGGSSFTNMGSVNDITHNNTNHFGFFCKYTSTRSEKFFFDDVFVSNLVTVDTVKPQLSSVEVMSDQILRVWFTENVSVTTAENTSNYSADNGLGQPSTATILASNHQAVDLTFGTAFQNQVDNVLTVENVADDSSNVMLLSTIHFLYSQPFSTAFKDVIITEFMADPSPVVGLPEEEYIEIYNNSNGVIDLNGWTIADGSGSSTLSSYVIYPDSYVLLCASGSSASYGIFNVLEGSWPSLNNTGDQIILKNELGDVVDSLLYTKAWYQDEDKEEGGWSLELKNINGLCDDASNWSAAIAQSGGTPGYENSIFTTENNTEKPTVSQVYLAADSSLYIHLSKSVSGGDIVVKPNIPFTQNTQGAWLVLDFNALVIKQTYQVTLSGFMDCWGNEMDAYSYTFQLPEQAEKGDVLINEILFNPITGGDDYLELVNVSDKTIALNELSIANIEDEIVGNIKALSNFGILWHPGQYLVFTPDSNSVITAFPNYAPGCFIPLSLPTYGNDSGTIVLLGEDNMVLDQFSYQEEMQFVLIDDQNGKALERLSFDLPTQSMDNWHTASELENWGTPGYKNSQNLQAIAKGQVTLTQAIFSPNNDGYQDFLEISYEITQVDALMDVVIYNSVGQQIKELKDNFYAGKSGVIIWDGIDDNGQKANVGSYIVAVRIFDLAGNVKQYKLVGVLATQL
ncbi:hypothetical protein DNU06_13010 [Putridiphycobacter roseus]|uniref:LTD domain-containing protein n=1 Tax=Putridiphycobacter roseus TaxID=2219161 RepID=A0A2W1NLC8_9FLAO|nr:lamin tail domain-containing protein [Putridiphycobacter roseus]PZE16462.1 hypothetical protein DNU06_13010 [Putridiphycobacter roseus]